MRRALSLGITLGLAMPACYASHELPIDPALCAPEGAYTVEVRVTRVDPDCGAAGVTMPLDVEIPPREELFGRAGDVTIDEAGPCRWEIHADILVPDLSRELDGTVDTSSGRVRGSFVVVTRGFTGRACTAHVEWTEAARAPLDHSAL